MVNMYILVQVRTMPNVNNEYNGTGLIFGTLTILVFSTIVLKLPYSFLPPFIELVAPSVSISNNLSWASLSRIINGSIK